MILFDEAIASRCRFGLEWNEMLEGFLLKKIKKIAMKENHNKSFLRLHCFRFEFCRIFHSIFICNKIYLLYYCWGKKGDKENMWLIQHRKRLHNQPTQLVIVVKFDIYARGKKIFLWISIGGVCKQAFRRRMLKSFFKLSCKQTHACLSFKIFFDVGDVFERRWS